jgi:recombinational DNA repair protein RecT
MSNLKVMNQQLEKATSIREALSLDFVKERFIKNYEGITGRKDGENRYATEVFHYMALCEEKPDLKKGSKFSHFAAIVKAGTTGLSFSKEGQLYPILYGNIVKIQIGAHGKRELLRRMPNVKMIHEAQLVLKGDEFEHDKLNNKIVKHVSKADTSKNMDKMSLENVYAAYCRIMWVDNTFTDVVMYHEEIVKAKSKSKNKGEASVWETWPGQMARKSTYNRAYTLYYSAPQVEVTDFKQFEVDEETEEVSHEEVVDQTTGEITAAEVVNEEQVPTQQQRPAQPRPTNSGMDEFLNN